MAQSVAIPSYFGALSAANLYCGFTVGRCFLVNEESSAKNVSSAQSRRSRELVAETKSMVCS